jgi:hypothetical protein
LSGRQLLPAKFDGAGPSRHGQKERGGGKDGFLHVFIFWLD